MPFPPNAPVPGSSLRAKTAARRSLRGWPLRHGTIARRPPTGQLDGLAVAEDELDRRPVEPELLAQPVLDVAPVAEVDQAGLVGEEDEGRRRDRGLRAVEDLRPAALDDRRRLAL